MAAKRDATIAANVAYSCQPAKGDRHAQIGDAAFKNILETVTNLLERLFVEERRRLKMVPNAFSEKPVL